VSGGEAALPILNREDIDLMLLDVRLPGISGFEVLRIIKENYALVEVIMISAINEIETAVQAMKHGAYHDSSKDFDYDELRSLVNATSVRIEPSGALLVSAGRDQTERQFVVGRTPRDIARSGGRDLDCRPGMLILRHRRAAGTHPPEADPATPVIASISQRSATRSALFGHERGAFTSGAALFRVRAGVRRALFLDEIGDLRPTQACCAPSGRRNRRVGGQTDRDGIPPDSRDQHRPPKA
jgi:DNA-binding NtrC family response regulator